MSESLRDRVARVLYEVATAGFTEVPSFDDAHEFDKADHYVATDALIAAGLVAEPPEGWLGGHCKYPKLRHGDCPGRKGVTPCICPCHEQKRPPREAL